MKKMSIVFIDALIALALVTGAIIMCLLLPVSPWVKVLICAGVLVIDIVIDWLLARYCLRSAGMLPKKEKKTRARKATNVYYINIY